MPWNITSRSREIETPPQTIEQAYERFIGHDTEIADYDAYAEAVVRIEDGKQPTPLGHHPDCVPGRYPGGMFDLRNEIHTDQSGVQQPVAVCIHCGYRIA